MAVNLDVGTNDEALPNDPAYLGNRHTRVRGSDPGGVERRLHWALS